VIVRPGSPYKVVSEVARELRADLVIVGRSAGNDLFGRLRANAYEIIRRSPCPVASV
jgi:nucleotide-binding universal stress UspA family protein